MLNSTMNGTCELTLAPVAQDRNTSSFASDGRQLHVGSVSLAPVADRESTGTASHATTSHVPTSHVPGAPVAKPTRRERGKNKPPAKIIPEKVLQAFNTWSFKREQPSDRQLMLKIIADAIELSRPIPFVLYWGKGLRCRMAEPDTQCLDFLAHLAARVREAYPPGAAIKLICTDTHARLNGHSPRSIERYFGEINAAAQQYGFETCRLAALTQAAETACAAEPVEEAVSAQLLARLAVSAQKWYRGEGSAEHGAEKYYHMNMIEKRAVELAFPHAIFVTFNDSEFRSLFPRQLPIFYMYSLRRGISVKPWFLPFDAKSCGDTSCDCVATPQAED